MTPFVERWHDSQPICSARLVFRRIHSWHARFGIQCNSIRKGVCRKSHFKKTRLAHSLQDSRHTRSLSLDQLSDFRIWPGACDCLAHTNGWPVAKGGSQSISNALAAYFKDLGGEIVTNHRVESLSELPPRKGNSVRPHTTSILRIAGSTCRPASVDKLSRYRYGPAAFKMDWALSDPCHGILLSVQKRRRFISAVHLPRSLPLKNSSTQVSTQRSLSSFFANRRSSIRRARRTANILSGLTATCPTDPRWT